MSVTVPTRSTIIRASWVSNFFFLIYCHCAAVKQHSNLYFSFYCTVICARTVVPIGLQGGPDANSGHQTFRPTP